MPVGKVATDLGPTVGLFDVGKLEPALSGIVVVVVVVFVAPLVRHH